MNDRMPPQADGLYDPRYEHDACGVAMVARLDNVPGHDVVVKALEALDNLEHRGAEGADIRTGDGAGILVQLPHAFFRSAVDFELPEPGRYGVAMCFLPADATHARKIEELLELNVRVEGQRVLGWRDVPVDPDHVGSTANESRPHIRQLFVEAGPGFEHDQDAFERKLYVIRRIVEDSEVKRTISTQKPYGVWFDEHVVHFNDLPPADGPRAYQELPLRQGQLAFGYTQEDLRVLHAPMARAAEEPVGSMGNDAALAVLSEQRPPLFSYFKQLFPQVP